MSEIYLVVENGTNTSYIDATLMALFYKSSCIDSMLTQHVDNSDFYYVQELIKNNFVNLVRKRHSVSADLINEIRNYCVTCGLIRTDDFIDIVDVTTFYDFFINGIGGRQLMIETIVISDKINTTAHTLSYIKLEPDDTFAEVSVTDLLREWIDNFILKTQDTSHHIHSKGYHFKQIPFIIPIFINRYVGGRKLTTKKLDIMKKIKFVDNDDPNQKSILWTIHSVLCFSDINPHYYSILNVGDEWYLYDSFMKPSLNKIDMKKEEFMLKIKQECIMIFYRIDDNYC